MNLPIDRWREGILFVIALVLSVGVHEFGHAWVANRLGDGLPKAQGRLTLNPLRHADWLGTLVLPFILAVSPAGGAMFGWGRPVSTNPSAFTRRVSRPFGSMLVAIAGPLMNLLMAVLVSLVIIVGARTGVMGQDLQNGLIRYLVQLNLVLLFFNLLPMPPLDGGSVLAWALPRSLQGVIDFLQKWGALLLVGLVLLPGVLEVVMAPAYFFIELWVMGLKGLTGA